MLLPITALEGVERNRLFSKYGINLIVLDKRINFLNIDSDSTSCWFNSSWFLLYTEQENNKLYFEKLNVLEREIDETLGEI